MLYLNILTFIGVPVVLSPLRRLNFAFRGLRTLVHIQVTIRDGICDVRLESDVSLCLVQRRVLHVSKLGVLTVLARDLLQLLVPLFRVTTTS
jgi:hypothetical protein